MLRLDSCQVCGGRRIRSWFTGRAGQRENGNQEWALDRCQDCGLGFLNPQPSWEDLSEFYDKSYAAYAPDHGAGGKTDEEIAAEARRKGEFRHIPLPRGKRVLDVGCGGGMFLRVCRLLGAEVAGVEPNNQAAERARAAGLQVFTGTCEQFRDLQLGHRLFDLITANHVLEHVPHPVETLAAMRHLVAEDGYIWIAVPNAESSAARTLGWRWYTHDLPFHLMKFTLDSLLKAGELAGLAPRRCATYSLPSAVAGTIRKYLRYRWLIPGRLTKGCGWIDNFVAPRLARKLDQRQRGQAIIVEFVKAGCASDRTVANDGRGSESDGQRGRATV